VRLTDDWATALLWIADFDTWLVKAKMQEAAVISAPDVQFVTGGWAKQYN
jgi:hypothetical protein